MVSLYGSYDPALHSLETAYPLAFPWNAGDRGSKPRYFRDGGLWWRDPAAQPTGRALVQCVGDLICEPQVGRAHCYGGQYFFHPLFQFVRPLLQMGDLNVGNLETTISEATPYASEYHCIARQYHCNAPVAFLEALRYAGFDGFTCANNHNCDSGAAGLIETNRHLDRLGFAHTGTFCPGQTDRAMLVEVNGIRLAFVAYASAFNRLDANFTAEGIATLLNPWDPATARADIAWAKQQGAEFVISYIHWGKSYVHFPTDVQRKQAQDLADAGADCIVGAHSHCLQINDTVTAADGRQVPVVYSMGNFITNEGQDLCRHCGVLQLQLEKQAGGVTCTPYFVPCYVADKFGTGRYCNVPADPGFNGGYTDPQLLRSADFAAQYIHLNAPPSGAMTLPELCALWNIPLPRGLENAAFQKISLQALQPEDRMLYFSPGGETDFEKLQLRRKNHLIVVTDTPWDDRYCSLVVPDVKRAYLQLCSHIRDRFPAQCVMVIGGSGKTAARTMIHGVLRQKYTAITHPDGPQIHSAVYQDLHPSTQWFVQEVRPNTPWGYDTQSQILKPAIVVVTADCVHTKDALVGMAPGGLVLLSGADPALCKRLPSLASRFPQLTFRLYGQEAAPGLLMEQAAGAAMAVAQALDIPQPQFPEYMGFERRIQDFRDIRLVLHTACPNLQSAAAAYEKARSFGTRVVAIADLRFALAMQGADVLLTTQTCEDRPRRVSAENALEHQALAAIRPGDTVLLCGMRDADLSTTARRLFGITDGVITDIW